MNNYHKKYYQKNKQKVLIHCAKQRGLGYILLMDNIFPDEIDIVYHHIRDVNNWIEEYIGMIGVC